MGATVLTRMHQAAAVISRCSGDSHQYSGVKKQKRPLESGRFPEPANGQKKLPSLWTGDF
jgi:hypothetical protein